MNIGSSITCIIISCLIYVLLALSIDNILSFFGIVGTVNKCAVLIFPLFIILGAIIEESSMTNLGNPIFESTRYDVVVTSVMVISMLGCFLLFGA
jgi:hypothetical protein